MKKHIILLALSYLLIQPIYAQIGTWTIGNRNHPELDWKTITTQRFNIHYHDGLKETAIKSAKIAEHVMPTLMQQMNLDTIPRIDITLTREDEFTNAFAVIAAYQVFIWVEQNDVGPYLEKNKWLESVIAHELQHVVFVERLKSWLPFPMDRLTMGLPTWVAEGVAEYMTESWRPYRADLEHKRHIIINPEKRDIWDPHADGFSKMLYWSERFGDSTIVKVLEYRSDVGLFNFEDAFKKINGITVKQFVEDWRVHMNTYYYGYRSQKEAYKEIGEVFTLPIKKMQSFAFYKDSTQMALLGLYDKYHLDVSLMIAERDTLKESKRYENWKEEKEKLKKKKKKSKKDSLKINQPYKEKVIWKKSEIDYGRFHEGLSWSPDGSKIAYAKYHYSNNNQSLVYDIKIYDKQKKMDRWITSSKRARYPTWVDSSSIAFVAIDNDTSNIYLSDLNGEIKALTSFRENTQIMYLSISPDYRNLAFAMSPKSGNMDIYTFEIESKKLKRITTHPSADLRPIWHTDGTAISFTSHRNGVPNIYTVNLSNGSINNNTDSGDGIISKQWMPNDDLLLTQSAINTTDSVRLIKMDPFRKPKALSFSINPYYSSWLNAGPDVSFVNELPSDTINISQPSDYKFWKTMRRTQLLSLPPNFTQVIWADAMNKNMIGVVGLLNDQKIDNSGFMLQYLTANYGPLIILTASRNSYLLGGVSFRIYDERNIFQYQNGLELALELPMNFSESLSSNHTIGFGMALFDHIVGNKISPKGDVEFVVRDEFANLPYPESGKESLVSLYYYWKNIRPHAWNLNTPIQGFGLNLQFDYADSSVFGDFAYGRFKFDSFINIPVKLGQGPAKSAVYIRLKSMKHTGSPPAQDYIGLTNDQPIYINGLGDPRGIIPENHNPRGWSGYVVGDQLVFGTLEYRLPFIPRTASINLISDYASVWKKNKQIKEVVTFGYELRISLGPISISAGDAQTNDGWRNNKKPLRYYRLALINPF